MSRSVAIVGGGPGGLFLARLLRRADPRTQVVVYERNPPDATFGFGVVFSERTLSGLREADPRVHDAIVAASRQWTDMELRVDGRAIRYGGFGFTAIARTTLLRILQDGAAAAGAELRFHDEASLGDVGGADVIVASDGVNSAIRTTLAHDLGTSEEVGAAKYAWFGTTARFDAVTFPFVETEHGRFAAHAYPYDAERSTFIVEVDEATWRRAHMDEWTAAAQAPGESDLRSRAYLEHAFAAHLGDAGLLVNNSKWASFRVIRNRRWHSGRVVLIGDAAHTAHFSVGSGTKMAMEDAVSLARALARHTSVAEGYAAYEQERRPAVARTQGWAQPSQRWWETFGRRRFGDPEQLGFHFITRTGAMSYRGLRRRAPDRVAAAERSVAGGARSALAAPLAIGGRTASCRLVLPLADIDPEAEPATVAAYLRSGAGMVIARVVEHLPERSAGGALLCVQLRASDADAVAAAAARGPDAIEIVDGASARLDAVAAERGADTVEGVRLAPAPLDAATIVAAAADVPVLVAWRVAPVDPWRAEGDALVSRARELVAHGVAGVRLLPDVTAPDREGGLRPHPALPGLALADRIRTETGAIVTLTAPGGWALDAPAANGDDWAAQAHMAIVAGRLDLLATWPLPPISPAPAAAARDGGVGRARTPIGRHA